MEQRFIVTRPLSDGVPGYWNPAGGGEWWADRDKAKVYRRRAAAERIAADYGGTILVLTSRLTDEAIAATDVLAVLKTVQSRMQPRTSLDSLDYQTFQRGALHAYGDIWKLLAELLSEQGIDVETELSFIER